MQNYIVMIKTIFWDFDGVIADSVNVKTDAFYELYQPYGEEIANKVKQYHLDNGGMSRFEKFRYYQEVLLGNDAPIPESVIQTLAKRFSDIVMKKVVNAPYIKGVEQILKDMQKCCHNYIITGTPTMEMKEILEQRSIMHYFDGVYGSPQHKDYWVNQLIEEHKYNRDESLFIGDAMSDMNAALKNNIHFILRRHKDNEHIFSAYKSHSIFDFTEFYTVFNKINKQ